MSNARDIAGRSYPQRVLRTTQGGGGTVFRKTNIAAAPGAVAFVVMRSARRYPHRGAKTGFIPHSLSAVA